MKPFFRRYGIPLLVSAVLHAGLGIASRFHSSDTPLSPRESARARVEELEEKIEAIRTAKTAFVNDVADDVKDGTLDSMPFSLFFLRSELFEAGLKNPVAMERFPELWQVYGHRRDELRPTAPRDSDLTSFLTTKKPEHAFGDPMNDYGRLIDLLQGVGYNCMARTKFHVALEHDLANNSGFRVKFVDNHIGLVSDPQLKDKGMTAPPEILVVGYLRKQGVPLGVLPKELAALYQRGVVGKDSFLKTTGIGEDLPPTGELSEEPIVMGVRLPEPEMSSTERPSNRSSLRPYEQLARGVLEFYDNGMMRPVSIPKGVDWCYITFAFYWDYLVGFGPLSAKEPPVKAPFEQLCYATQIPAQWGGMNFPGFFEKQKKMIREMCRAQIMQGAFDYLEEECIVWYTHYDRLPDADLEELIKRYKRGDIDSPLPFFDPSNQLLKELFDHDVSSGNPSGLFETFFYSAKSENTPLTVADFVAGYTTYASKIKDEKRAIFQTIAQIELWRGAKPPLIEAVGEYLLRRAVESNPDLAREVQLILGDADDESLVPLLADELEQQRTDILANPQHHPRRYSDIRIVRAFRRYTPLLIRHPEILGVPIDTTPHTGNHNPQAHAYLSFRRYFQHSYTMFPPVDYVLDKSTQAFLLNLGHEEIDSYVHDALVREGFMPVK